MSNFKILCGRPLGHELCRYDYEALRFGFGLVFDRELDRRAVCSTDFLTTIAGRYRKNIHVRCDYKKAEDFLELGVQVIMGIDSIINNRPFAFGFNNAQIIIEVSDPGQLEIVTLLRPAAIILGEADVSGKIGHVSRFSSIRAAVSKCTVPVIVRGHRQMIANAFTASCAGIFLDILPAGCDWCSILTKEFA